MKKNILALGLMMNAWMVNAQEVLRVQNGATLSVQNSGAITIQGGITLENGSSVINDGSITLKNNSVSNQSDWLDNSLLGAMSGTGMVMFNSSNGNNFTGPTSFFDVFMDAAGGLTLNNDLTGSNKLRFINGKINTGSNYIFLNNNSAASLENDVSNTGYANT